MAKILIVDDAMAIREEVQTWLQFEDHDVAVAANGKEGMEKALELVPDLIVCDALMPVMNGYQLLAQIRSFDVFKQTRFIFMTAKASEDDILEGIKLGANGYLIKPFTFAELLDAVNKQLN